MSHDEAGKNPASGKTPASPKSDAELKDNELDEISGGVALTKPTNPHLKKPNKYISDPPP